MKMFVGALGMLGAIFCSITAYYSYTMDDIKGGVIETIFAIGNTLISAYCFTI